MAENNTCSCNCNCADKIYVGTTLKVAINPTATDFDPRTDNWTVEVRYGSQNLLYKVFQKEDLIDDDERYYAIIDTNGMIGDVKAIVRAEIPDDDCDDGIRYEVAVATICKILPV